MSIYYVSANGCDNADGLSPETAWKTIAKINSSIIGGDEVRFRCGDTFYGRITTPAGPDMEHPTTLTSYGEGEKPTISLYKIAIPEKWEKHEDGVYKLDLTAQDTTTGLTDPNSNIGFMKISGVFYYRKKFRYEDLEEQWDFYCDEQYIYIKCDKCPAEYSDDIKLAAGLRCIAFANNIKVCGITVRGGGAHGISGVTVGARIYDCEFHELGGSRLGGLERNGKFNTTRYGNGVECWSNSSDVIVENCKFSEIYDVAITMQGNAVVKNWENMYFRNNIMWNCVQFFEIWSSGDQPDTGFVNCFFENNVCINAGYCWGYDARPNKGVSTPLLIYGLQCPLCDITVRNNVFSGSRLATVFKSGGPAAIPSDYKIYNNTIIRPKGQPMAMPCDNTPEQCDAFEKLICDNNYVVEVATYQNEI
ncbi:MAG: hypothetical protein IKV97_04190 [Clostridia bacterium]|nr:hypothetical protein [Clostridia bacterium]